MQVSLNWLRKYADLPGDINALSTALTALGFEVESVRVLGGAATGVVAAEVLECVKHPEADKLSLCVVTDGAENFPVVCGAPNVAAGQKVLLAKVGAELPGGLQIKKAKIRGRESLGMLCAEDELGLGEGHDGILVLDASVPSGTPLRDVPGLCDAVFELNVTPNRPDALSHLGVARELAARFGKPLSYPKEALREAGPDIAGLISLKLEDMAGCTLYVGRVIQGVKVGASPEWLVKALKSMGKKSINNVVDLTNYALLELGQPFHAFDLARIAGKKVIVRSGAVGEKLITLDGVERRLTPEDLVIADANGPMVLAGVMGGMNSGVDSATVDIFLETAYFTPSTVRRQARRHGLSSDSSHRFERGVDPLNTDAACDYLAALISRCCGGQVAKGAVRQASPEHPASRRIVYMRPARAAKVLGANVDAAAATALLEAIGLRRKDGGHANGEEALAFEIPGFRGDLEIEADLIEEVARLGDYNNIPAILPSLPLTSQVLPPMEKLSRTLRHFLRDAGLNETLNLRFTSRKALVKLELLPEDPRQAFVPLRNPISEEWEILPTTSLPSLLQAVAHNQNNQERDCRFFEIAKAFFHRPGERDARRPGVKEEERLYLAVSGEWADQSWAGTAAPARYFHLKGLLENLLALLGQRAVFAHPSQERYLHPVESADIVIGDVKIGGFGTLHPRAQNAFGLKGPVLVAELSRPALLAAAKPENARGAFAPFGHFSAMTRDANIVVDEKTHHGDIVARIPVGDIPHLLEVRLNSVYQGSGVPEGKKALHYSFVYRHSEKTLTDDEVNKSQEKLLRELGKDGALVFK